jgi:HK97 family phage portal protein
VKLWTRAIRPSSGDGDVLPNDTVPPESDPGTAGYGDPRTVPGDPHGVLVAPSPPLGPPTVVTPSPWSGWPAEWSTSWQSAAAPLTDIAWACVDLNASVLAAMPPYLVGAAESLDADWLVNPNPDVYTSWEEFAKALAWDYQLGEAFVLATAWYATGYPARFHVVPPWAVTVELEAGVRRYSIGGVDVTEDICHIRYRSSVDTAHGQGPLEVGQYRLVAADVLGRYASGVASSGGVPAGILTHPDELTAAQSKKLREDWVAARLERLGGPAVLSGGVEWQSIQTSPKDLALLELGQASEARIAVLLGVPPFLVGLPSAGEQSMTYSNVSQVFDFHWRAGLRPKAQAIMAALSGFLLPRATTVEVNRDAYVQADPEARARTYSTLHAIQDERGPALTVDEIRALERFDLTGVRQR